MPSFSSTLEQAIHKALSHANERSHEFATLEHLLLALLDEPDAQQVMRACDVDIVQLRQSLTEYVEDELSTLVTDVEGSEAVPTAAFQRVIQRAAIHVQSSGRTEVTGANVLVAMFAERESNAAYFLQDQNMTRYDAVNFIAHGLPKILITMRGGLYLAQTKMKITWRNQPMVLKTLRKKAHLRNIALI